MVCDRRRSDAAGGGPRAAPERQACRAALRRVAEECRWPRRVVAALRLVDYEPSSGDLRLSGAAHDSVVLSRRGRRTMERWLAFRGSADGKLFEVPAAVTYNDTDLRAARELDERRDPHAIEGGEQLAESEIIQRLCTALAPDDPQLARLTKKQRYRARLRCIERWRELSRRDG